VFQIHFLFLLENCPVGHYSPTGLAPCQKCPMHSYSVELNSLECAVCPRRQRTQTEGSSTAEKCKGNYFITTDVAY